MSSPLSHCEDFNRVMLERLELSSSVPAVTFIIIITTLMIMVRGEVGWRPASVVVALRSLRLAPRGRIYLLLPRPFAHCVFSQTTGTSCRIMMRYPDSSSELSPFPLFTFNIQITGEKRVIRTIGCTKINSILECPFVKRLYL